MGLSKAIKQLQRRRDFLVRQTPPGGEANDYVKAEIAALTTALEELRVVARERAGLC